MYLQDRQLSSLKKDKRRLYEKPKKSLSGSFFQIIKLIIKALLNLDDKKIYGGKEGIKCTFVLFHIHINKKLNDIS